MFRWLKAWRRKKLLSQEFPTWHEAIMRRNIGHYARLSQLEQVKLREVTQILIAEKSWEGCGGLHITDEIKITIAASAGLLLLGIPEEYFERVPSIIVYPAAFRTPQAEDDWEDDGLSESESDGQAVYRGPVILSWSQLLVEAREPELGYNVALHEFAHQLDFLTNSIDGTPPLGDRILERRWQLTMQEAFERHRSRLAQGQETFFTDHAGDHETEFFADATEAFYCRPHDLESEEPEVFSLLQAYFRVDPRVWFPEEAP